MRLLHTSDWHLGRAFHQMGMLDAQAAFVDHLVDLARSERVDAVVVSGDIYDRALPTPDTVALLSEALTRLVDTGARIIVSSGNHDSAIRLGFAGDLLSRAGLHIGSTIESVGTPVVVAGVAIYPIPYLEPALAAPVLGSEISHDAVLRAAMDRVRLDAPRHRRSVVMAHAFVSGAMSSDSERDITVGGVAMVGADVFDGVDYVALGHLHRPQTITDAIRYSGSPIALSFGEAGHPKSSLLVDLSGATPRCEGISAPVTRRLALLHGDLDRLLTDPDLAHAESAWCQITLTDPIRPPAAMDRLRSRFPHTLKLLFESPERPVDLRTYATKVAARSTESVCCDFVGHVRSGVGPTDEERVVLTEAIEGARLDRAGREGEGAVAAATGTSSGTGTEDSRRGVA